MRIRTRVTRTGLWAATGILLIGMAGLAGAQDGGMDYVPPDQVTGPSIYDQIREGYEKAGEPLPIIPLEQMSLSELVRELARFVDVDVPNDTGSPRNAPPGAEAEGSSGTFIQINPDGSIVVLPENAFDEDPIELGDGDIVLGPEGSEGRDGQQPFAPDGSEPQADPFDEDPAELGDGDIVLGPEGSEGRDGQQPFAPDGSEPQADPFDEDPAELGDGDIVLGPEGSDGRDGQQPFAPDGPGGGIYVNPDDKIIVTGKQLIDLLRRQDEAEGNQRAQDRQDAEREADAAEDGTIRPEDFDDEANPDGSIDLPPEADLTIPDGEASDETEDPETGEANREPAREAEGGDESEDPETGGTEPGGASDGATTEDREDPEMIEAGEAAREDGAAADPEDPIDFDDPDVIVSGPGADDSLPLPVGNGLLGEGSCAFAAPAIQCRNFTGAALSSCVTATQVAYSTCQAAEASANACVAQCLQFTGRLRQSESLVDIAKSAVESNFGQLDAMLTTFPGSDGARETIATWRDSARANWEAGSATLPEGRYCSGAQIEAYLGQCQAACANPQSNPVTMLCSPLGQSAVSTIGALTNLVPPGFSELGQGSGVSAPAGAGVSGGGLSGGGGAGLPPFAPPIPEFEPLEAFEFEVLEPQMPEIAPIILD